MRHSSTKDTMAKLVFILLCLHFVAIVYSRDDTITSGFGEDVVDAVLDKIDSSCIFKNDHFFMKRIALLGTNYGNDVKYSKGKGGIWKISWQMTYTVRYYCLRHMRRYCNAVNKVFGFNMGRVTYDEMDVPLKSALLMRTFLRVYLYNIPASTYSQGILWRILISYRTVKEFMDKATIQPACFYPKVDLIFAIDSSISVGKGNFLKTLAFLKAVVGGLNIGSEYVRVGLIEFSSNANTVFNFNQHTSAEAVINAIDSVSYSPGSTNTYAALHVALNNFKSGARSNVPKVLVLITDGYSNNFFSTVDAAKKLKGENVDIFAIGIGNVKELEMLQVSSDPSCNHFFKLSSYTDMVSIIHQIQRKVCEAPIKVAGSAKDVFIPDNKLPPQTATKIQRIIVDSSNTDNVLNTIRVAVVCGVVNMYVSRVYPSPNSALYDDKDAAKQGIAGWFHTKPRARVHISLVSQRRTDDNNPLCNNPHYNISVNPTNTYFVVVCIINGVSRECTDGEIKEKFKHLFADENSDDIPNPCTKENIMKGNMTHPHPDPNQPNKYIECKFTGEMEIVTCSAGTIYNVEQHVCSPHVIPPTCSKPYTGPNPCTKENMVQGKYYFPYSNDPEWFIQCTEWGDASLVCCPNNTVWSQKVHTCIDVSVVSNNPCNSSSGIYYYQNPKNKTSFIQCDGNDNPFVMPCPPTTIWDKSNRKCITDTNPVTKPCTTPCTTGQYCPFPGDEKFYYQCVHQKLEKRPCSGTTKWSQTVLNCV